MKGLVIVGDLFEDTELLGTIDVLLRHNESITIASMMKRKEVISKCGIKMNVDALIEEINLQDYDFLFIPGGPGSFKILANIKEVDDVIDYFVNHNKLVTAICAAPMLIGRREYFKGQNYTVHPGFEQNIVGGNYLRDQGVVVSNKFITAKSMYYSIELGLKIIEYYYGQKESEKLRLSLQGEK